MRAWTLSNLCLRVFFNNIFLGLLEILLHLTMIRTLLYIDVGRESFQVIIQFNCYLLV